MRELIICVVACIALLQTAQSATLSRDVVAEFRNDDIVIDKSETEPIKVDAVREEIVPVVETLRTAEPVEIVQEPVAVVQETIEPEPASRTVAVAEEAIVPEVKAEIVEAAPVAESSEPIEAVRTVAVEEPVEAVRTVLVEEPVEAVRTVVVEEPAEAVRTVAVEEPIEAVRTVAVEPVEALRTVAVEEPVEAVRSDVPQVIAAVAEEIIVPVQSAHQVETLVGVDAEAQPSVKSDIIVEEPVKIVEVVVKEEDALRQEATGPTTPAGPGGLPGLIQSFIQPFTNLINPTEKPNAPEGGAAPVTTNEASATPAAPATNPISNAINSITGALNNVLNRPNTNSAAPAGGEEKPDSPTTAPPNFVQNLVGQVQNIFNRGSTTTKAPSDAPVIAAADENAKTIVETVAVEQAVEPVQVAVVPEVAAETPVVAVPAETVVA